MPIPLIPSNFLVQSGNGTVYLSWNASAGTTGYNLYRSQNNQDFSLIANLSSSSISYYDNTATSATEYWYRITAGNTSGTSSPTTVQSVTCVGYGQASLGGVRLAAQQRADMVNNNFVTTQEWNSYINLSYFELYDILVQVYGDDYYVAPRFTFTTDGRQPSLYPLPLDIYKLLGVDLGVNAAQNSYVTMRKFMFQNRNKFQFNNVPIGYYGNLNIEYRLVGSNIDLIQSPASGQTIVLWYIPRPRTLLADSDILEGVSGWEEYVIVDAAIKALNKEESDVTALMAAKAALKQRIESAASNRDAGMPEVVTDVRGGLNGYFNGGFGYGYGYGGWGNGY